MIRFKMSPFATFTILLSLCALFIYAVPEHNVYTNDSYLETLFFIDHELATKYKPSGFPRKAIRDYVLDIIYGANLLTREIRMHLVIKNIIQLGDPSMNKEIDFDPDNSVRRAIAFEKYLKKHYPVDAYDAALLLSGHNTVIGDPGYYMGNPGMCRGSGGVITFFNDASIPYNTSSLEEFLARTLGHAMGLRDDLNCDCKDCIMRLSHEDPTTRKWSNCSLSQASIGLECTRHLPRVTGIDVPYSVCGNGITERAEDCDCPKTMDGMCPDCCDTTTCKSSEVRTNVMTK